MFEGIRDTILVGYGLVIGLNGSGDSLNNSPLTRQSLAAMLERLGVNARGGNGNTDNLAAVMVTTTLPRSPVRAPASRSRSARSATPRTGKAACFWSCRCSAPTARSTRWPRVRERSAAFPPRARPAPALPGGASAQVATEFVNAVPSTEVVHILREVGASIEHRNFFQALKQMRKLIAYEEKRLNYAG